MSLMRAHAESESNNVAANLEFAAREPGRVESKAAAKIPVAGPWITDKEVSYVADAARNGWYERWNEYPTRFEEAFAARLGVRHAVSGPSGTAAIHLALAALGIGPGDEVIVPELTWIASATPVVQLGAMPVFADVDPVTWGLSPEAFAKAITPRTKAVVPVDLYGGIPDMDPIRKIADAHRIAVLEDAAEALGSTYFDRPAGTLGDVAAFSFHGTKTMTTGEGGMLVTDDDALHERCLVLRDQGRATNARHRFWNEEIGYKFRMSAVQAALGLAQTERLDELVAKKRQIFAWYEARLSGMEQLRLNPAIPGVWNSYWMVTAMVDPKVGLEKEALMGLLATDGIDSRPFFYPLSCLPAFKGHPQRETGPQDNPVAYSLSPYGINLPSALMLTEADVERVCSSLRRHLSR
ncbi:MAG TPA: DegT/DnrJ/EryC1/StrS family aminotransferase [Dehalococcoidia bacterium]|nr:DegT/DnrJ/EryC1/StrS family aminotransferase [Dehalococcoidia bacterium]